MDIHLISYASNRFLERRASFSRELAAFSAAQGLKSSRIYGPGGVGGELSPEQRKILAQRRGGGYWIWKPFIVADYLARIAEGDILLYVDVGCRLNSGAAAQQRFRDYIKLIAEHGLLRFELPFAEAHYSNARAIDYVAERYGVARSALADTPQLMATFFGIKKGADGLRFAREWLDILNDDPYLFTDYYNGYQNRAYRALFTNFAYSALQTADKLALRFGGKLPNRAYELAETHRHDQSVASLLHKALKVGTTLPDETFNHGTEYPINAVRLMR